MNSKETRIASFLRTAQRSLENARASLGNAQCSVGIHTGEFRYGGDHSCVMARTCERCGSPESRTVHQYGPWAAQQPACAQVSTCRRCQATLSRVVHRFGWHPIPGAADPCLCQHNCGHCGQPGRPGSTVRHTWGRWQLSFRDNSATNVCTVCGERAVVRNNQPRPALPRIKLPDFTEGWQDTSRAYPAEWDDQHRGWDDLGHESNGWKDDM